MVTKSKIQFPMVAQMLNVSPQSSLESMFFTYPTNIRILTCWCQVKMGTPKLGTPGPQYHRKSGTRVLQDSDYEACSEPADHRKTEQIAVLHHGAEKEYCEGVCLACGVEFALLSTQARCFLSKKQ